MNAVLRVGLCVLMLSMGMLSTAWNQEDEYECFTDTCVKCELNCLE